MVTVKDIVVRKPTPEEVAKARQWPIWEHGVAEFEWDYTQKEICLIMEGSVTVSERDRSNSVDFGEGDWVELPSELACIWKIHKPVRKHYSFE